VVFEEDEASMILMSEDGWRAMIQVDEQLMKKRMKRKKGRRKGGGRGCL